MHEADARGAHHAALARVSTLPLCSVSTALLSVYDKTGLLPLAQGLHELGFRLLGSGGTAKLIREANIPIECVPRAQLY